MTGIKGSRERLDSEESSSEDLIKDILNIIDIDKDKFKNHILNIIDIDKDKFKNHILNIIDKNKPSLLEQVSDLFSRIESLELLLNTLDTSNKLFSLRELVKLHKELISLLPGLDDNYKSLKNQIQGLNTKLIQYERMLEDLEVLNKKIIKYND